MKIAIDFVSSGNKIYGRFYFAKGDPPFPTILLLHGFPGNEEDVLELGQRISQYRINVLTFNYRGTYWSEGTFSLKNTLEDISAGFEYLHQEDVIRKFQIDASKLILGGYSYGGGMALVYAASHSEIKRIVSIAGGDLGEVAREYKRNTAFAETLDKMFEELKSPIGPVRFADKPIIEELMQIPNPYDLIINAPKIANCDILLLSGWDDQDNPIEHHLLPLYRALVAVNAPKIQIAACQDNHAFERSREELAGIISRWVISS